MKKLAVLLMSFVMVLSFLPGKEGKSFGGLSDVTVSYWAYDYIMPLVDQEIIRGFEDGTFKPERQVTRGQAAMLIGRALELDTQNRPDPGFSDVSPTTSGYDYIAALVDEGVFMKAEKFNPAAPLKRSQMSKILVEAFELTGTSSKTFTDVTSAHWARGYISTLLANEITTGRTPDRFDPEAHVNRAQMAVFIYRTLYGEIQKDDSSTGGQDPQMVNEILTLINKERAAEELAPLKLDPAVQELADLKAADMRDNDYFDHFSPKYGTIFQMMDEKGITRKSAGENIAAGQSGASSAMNAWMNSEGHRANILNPGYTHVGIGYSEGGSYGTYFVQVFVGK
ncbi:S-layer homology domain-containing protein [Jeotgalibacillus aurantiacus]|uniref:S-layer homology domain-containing protein n=1 Tax=Jeotgalibacillus aurantiacus TaxID=2763266 RepID=UPI001D0A2E25|nr:S-layer homology domain-containing protein [Jeotgalibacillus aurantiacus]